jgi:hypothetical protein
MKRSEINNVISKVIKSCENNKLPLPPFAYYDLEDWKKTKKDQKEIIENMLGWDVTDFGTEDFYSTGLAVFVFRNGNLNKIEEYPKSYCEKLLYVFDGQKMPAHFHWQKSEDIINRGGGDLEITLWEADDNNEFSEEEVTVTIDGKKITVEAGESIILNPGESITLLPYQYHQWQAVPGTGDVFVFEVSTTNDDNVDNHFYNGGDRIPEVIEDEEIEYLMFADYEKVL